MIMCTEMKRLTIQAEVGQCAFTKVHVTVNFLISRITVKFEGRLCNLGLISGLNCCP